MNIDKDCNFVIVPPAITVTVPDSAPYYTVEDYITMECVATGNPTPTLVWKWQQCDRPGCDIEESSWRNVEDSRNIPNVEESAGMSQLLVVSKESGFYKCIATNKIATVTKQEKFVATGL